ncbi:MAG: DNA-processing protein DprA [Butyrivibrio sp.]|nr:DNA-processing protein DprA [Butyrivibrio sp.]
MILSEKDYAHWLFSVQGVGNASIDKLLCGGRSCREVFEMNEKELAKILDQRHAGAIMRAKRTWDFEKKNKKLEAMGIRFVSRIDPEYPDKLRNIADPPFAIYVKGQLPDPSKPSVAIIGARMCSDYGRFMARKFGRELGLAGVQVISGMARGVDGIAQKGALDAGGRSFGVLGCGVDICYPEENKAIYDDLITSGGIISEYLPGTEPKPGHFPLRNRIISALSDIVLVVEARRRSGTSITVDTALEQGKEILAVPGRVTDRLSDGCNYLINQGAGIATGVQDILDRLSRMGMYCTGSDDSETEKTAETEGNELSEIMEESDDEMSETSVTVHRSLEDEIAQMLDVIPISASQIMEELGKKGYEISVPQLMSTLMEMTFKGIAIQNGSYYRKTAV